MCLVMEMLGKSLEDMPSSVSFFDHVGKQDCTCKYRTFCAHVLFPSLLVLADRRSYRLFEHFGGALPSACL